MITYDNYTLSARANTDTITFNHTCTGSNRILIVAVHIDNDDETVSSVTYNGVNLIYIGRATSPAGIGDNRTELWYKVGPTTGENEVVVTLSGANDCVAGAISYTGVDSSTPIGTPATANDDTDNNDPYYLLTNLINKNEYTYNDLKILYKKRWSVETDFMYTKHYL